MSPELENLLARAKVLVDSWTPQQRDEHFRVQRENLARSYREAPESETSVVVVQRGPDASNAAVQASQPDYRAILLALASSLTLSDHMGDAMEDVWQALKLAGMAPPPEVADDDGLRDWLENVGTPSLWGGFPPVGNS